MYDAAMERITRWAPGLKDRFERAAAQIKVKHKLAASLEERAAGSARKRTIEEAVEEAVEEAPARVPRKTHPSMLCRGCEIDGVHIECSFSPVCLGEQ